MKTHTSSYKENIKEFGCEIDAKITYQLNNETIELGTEELNSVVPHYEGAILKSVMKQLDLDSNVDIPLNTILNAQFGVKVGNEYEYISFGNFAVYSSEKQEDTDSWRIVCYDKMLYSMKNYEKLDITYPITIRNYINEICTHLGLTFANASGVFVNYDKEIQSELYLDGDDNTLGYTFRNVLDELAQTTASTICINDDDELEIRYINDAVTSTNEVEGSEISISDVVSPKIVDLKLKGNTSQETTTGKNLFNINATPSKVGGGTTYSVNNGVLKVSGRWYIAYQINVLANTDYYVSATRNVISRTSSSGNISIYDSSVTTPITGGYGNNFTFNSGSNTTISIVLYSGKGTEGEVDFSNIQFEKGSTATSYEPYTGGIPAPNPDYPMPINVVSGDNTVKICGKNLIPFINQDFTLNNVRYYVKNGSLYVNGVSSGETTTSNVNFKNNFSFILKAGTYTLQCSTKLAVYLKKYNDNSNIFSNPSWVTSGRSFTLNEDAQLYIGFYVYQLSFDNDNLEIQLEKGTTATSYEPHQEQTYPISLGSLELCKIGNYQDYIYKDNGKWYKYGAIGKVVLDGSEDSWIENSGTKGLFQVTLSNVKYNNNNTIYAKSNLLIGTNGYYVLSTSDYVDNSIASYNANRLFFRLNSYANNLAGLKTMLSTNNMTAYYVLNTPTITEITDITLISQLNAIKLFKGTNNIEFSGTDIAGILNIKYTTGIDTIDEDYLKDVNATFGQKYGPVNSVVLSRSAESDNVYLQDEDSVEKNGLCEIKITDNQIMNFNDRSDYLPGILNELDGLEYYINDFSSSGITYYDLCDRYNVQVGESTYPCVMLNDEVNITQGLEEIIHTKVPEGTVTDYTKADKTDRKINQTQLIVDKQQGVIESLVSNTTYVSDTKTGTGSITLENAYAGQLYQLSIKGNISLLFPQSSTEYGFALAPRDDLVPSNTLVPSSPVPYGNEVHYPSDNLFSKSSNLIIDDKEYKLDFDFLNYMSNTICDEFKYENGTCYIIRRVGIDSQGNMYALDNEVIEPRKGIILEVDKTSTISLKSFPSAILSATYLLENQITSNFATQVEVQSEIKQTADSINLKVDSKVDNEDYTGANILLKINQDESEAQINADKISLSGKTINLTSDNIAINSTNFSVTTGGDLSCTNANISGTITSNDGTIGGWTVDSNGINNGILFIRSNGYSTVYTVADIFILEMMLSGTISMPTSGSAQFKHYDINNDGQITITDLVQLERMLEMDN